MHCRFVREEMEPHLEAILSRVLVPNNPTHDRLVNSISSLNDGVVRLSRDSNPLTWKFSVRSPDITDSCTFVHLSKYGEFVFCLSSESRAQRGNRKKTRLLLTDSQHVAPLCAQHVAPLCAQHVAPLCAQHVAPLCAHLEMMRAHHNLWSHLVVGTDIQDSSDAVNEVHNREDECLHSAAETESSRPRFFDAASRKWDFGGYSTHQPQQQQSAQLAKCNRKRASVCDDEDGQRTSDGFLVVLDLFTLLPDRCNCEVYNLE